MRRSDTLATDLQAVLHRHAESRLTAGQTLVDADSRQRVIDPAPRSTA
jgi:hypothetical protein